MKKDKKQPQAKIRNESNDNISDSLEDVKHVFTIIDSEHKIAVQYCQIIIVIFTVLTTILVTHIGNSKSVFSDPYKYFCISALFIVFLAIINSYRKSIILINKLSTGLQDNKATYKQVTLEYSRHSISTLRMNFWMILLSFSMFANTASLSFVDENIFSTSWTTVFLIYDYAKNFADHHMLTNFSDFYH